MTVHVFTSGTMAAVVHLCDQCRRGSIAAERTEIAACPHCAPDRPAPESPEVL